MSALRPKAALAALAVAALSFPAGSRGENLEISPVSIELSKASPSILLTVRNGGSTPMRYQVSAFDWKETLAGETKLSPTQEVVIFPTVFQLGVGETRKVRVGTALAAAAAERSWRVFVEELPMAVTKADATQVKLRVRFALPAFLAPVKEVAGSALELRRDGKRLVATIRNSGNVHFRPTALRFALAAEADGGLLEADGSPWYVLAGDAREHTFDVPAEICAKVRRASVVAELRTGRLEAHVDLPDGACGQ
jgi:fimbrial chaperone protein